MVSCYAWAASPPARWMAAPPPRSMRCWNAGPVLLSNVEPGGRLHFYLLRRPVVLPDEESDHGDSVSAIARRRRKAFLAERLQDVQAYLVWCHDPGLQQATATDGRGPWWLNTARAWLARQRAPHEAVYIYDEIEAAASRFRAACRCGFEARLRPDPDHAVERPGRGPFLE